MRLVVLLQVLLFPLLLRTKQRRPLERIACGKKEPHPRLRRRSELTLVGCAAKFEGNDTDDSIINRMHLGVHGQGLSTALRIIAIIMGAIMVMSRRYHLSALDKDRTKSKTHSALRGGIGALELDDR